MGQSILWHRIDRPGHEAARLSRSGSRWHLACAAVFANGQRPCRLDYVITCDEGWRALSAKVGGWADGRTIDVEISVDRDHRWRINGRKCEAAAGCIDLDLNFSPSTNLLPIRRLDLAAGCEAAVTAAWLRFPDFNLEPLDQLYRRLDAATYRYESAGVSPDLFASPVP